MLTLTKSFSYTPTGFMFAVKSYKLEIIGLQFAVILSISIL